LNLDNKLCNANRNKLVFANSVDTSANDGGYLDLDLDADADVELAIKLKKWIINAIKLWICKNNVLVAARIMKKGAKKA
jgi:hypothetical protein